MKNKHLTAEQRYSISQLLRDGKTQTYIAKVIGVNRSTISRELKRNKIKRSYSPTQAQMLANERKERFKRSRAFTLEIELFVRDKIINEQWSPEQITGYCRKNGIQCVSHQRIYQYVKEDKATGGMIYKKLRHRLKHRKRPLGGGKKVIIKDKVSIDERPDIINNKERFGDWEIDTIVGKNNKGAIVTITERTTGFLLARKLPYGKNAKELAKVVFYALLPYKEVVHSITSDNGTEFAEHKWISEKLETDFYFAHPYSSWERGLNEYTNKLIRQYIPKKETFEKYEDKFIKEVQKTINKRPRKKLNFESPMTRFFKMIN